MSKTIHRNKGSPRTPKSIWKISSFWMKAKSWTSCSESQCQDVEGWIEYDRMYIQYDYNLWVTCIISMFSTEFPKSRQWTSETVDLNLFENRDERWRLNSDKDTLINEATRLYWYLAYTESSWGPQSLRIKMILLTSIVGGGKSPSHQISFDQQY